MRQLRSRLQETVALTNIAPNRLRIMVFPSKRPKERTRTMNAIYAVSIMLLIFIGLNVLQSGRID